MKPSQSNSKIDYGAVAEQKVAAELLLRGHLINWATSDKLPYDFISDKDGKLSKIQVKGIFNQDDGRPHRCELRGYQNREYLRHEVDYFIVYIHSLNEYYIIPFGMMTSFNRNGKAKHFLSAWDLLK